MNAPSADADARLDEGAQVEIKAVKGLVPLNLHELWEYRELAFFMLLRDIKGRYRQMAFGPLWMIINPIMNVIVFTVIFGRLAKLPSDDIPYPLFSYAALLPWTFFTASLFTASGSLLGYKDLISKVYFPRLVIPLVGVLSALVDFIISFMLLMCLALYYGYSITWNIIFIPAFLAVAGLTGLAVGIWFASWIVHFRDVNAILGYIVRAWMYATPVVYAASLVPERWRFLYRLNPLTGVVDGFRWALLGTGRPDLMPLCVSMVIVMLLLVTGMYHFRHTERNIVDIA